MRFFLLSVCYFINQLSYSQINSLRYSKLRINNLIWTENQTRLLKKDNKVKQQTITQKGKGKNSTTTSVFSSDGRITEFHVNAKNYFKITYHNDSLIEQVIYYDNNVIKKRDSISYSGTRIKNKYRLDENNRNVESEEYTYDSTYITQYIYKKRIKGNMKELRKHVYEYYPDHSYKKITTYKKGKIKFVNNFDCNPIGEVKYETAQNCIKYETDSLGNKIKITMINSNSWTVKQIEYYNKQDKVVAAKTYAQPSNKVIWEYYYNSKNYLTEKFISYNDRKKELYRLEYKYNPVFINNYDELCRYKRKKLIYKNVKEYGEKGLLIESIEINKRNRIRSKQICSYQYY